uniref:RING-type domain-containing protein n=1 Tax=Haemonchus contortus TaxID=6289 RepID=A0A7I4YAT7_HAECO|nr:Hypothetical protein CBG17986 [Haemonchus contortus]
MWSASETLAGLVPNCICGASYDLRFCAPHSLPCAHTFCLMCLSKEKQRKKRRCPSCRKKYSSFILNTALAEVVKRVRQRRECLEHRSLRCDECDSRRSATAMRRCLSCSRAMNKHMSTGLTLDCVICLECCVNRHNGHDLTTLPCPSNPSPPVASSTPRNDSQRNMPWEHFLRTRRQCVQGRNAHKRANGPKPDHRKPRVPVASSMIDDELVYEARSPLYYQIQQSEVEDISISTGIAKQLSGLVISVTGVCNTTSEQEEPVYPQKSTNSPDSGILATSDGSTTDRRDSDVSPYQSISPYAAAFPGYSLCSTLKLEKTESSSLYQRVTPILRLKEIFARKPPSLPCLRS